MAQAGDAGPPDKRRYGLAWWGAAVWWGGSAIMLLGIALLIILIATILPPPALTSGRMLLWMVMIAIWSVWLLMFLWATNTWTTVTLDVDGLWIRVFLRPHFVAWSEIKQMQHRPFPSHIVYVKYISPIHWAVAAPLAQSFPLVLGLDQREELFWEIHRRASRAQGRDIPVFGWLGGRRR